MALAAIPTYITLQKYYVDGLSLTASTVGIVLFFSRMLDAITDPIIGWVSDRLNTPISRQNPLIYWVAFYVGSACGLCCNQMTG